MNKIIVSIILFLMLSCNDDKIEDEKVKDNNQVDTLKRYTPVPMDDIYRKDYKEFYINRLAYEMKTSAPSIELQRINQYLLMDSLHLVPLIRRNLKYHDLKEKAILFVKEKICLVDISIERSYIFYKYVDERIVQLEFPIEESGRNKMVIFFIRNNLNNEKIHKAGYIRWTSLEACYFKGYTWEEKKETPIYMWGINKSTDTVETNLCLKSIKELYPDFQGTYVFKKYKEIIVDYKYSTLDQSLFKHIKFVE